MVHPVENKPKQNKTDVPITIELENGRRMDTWNFGHIMSDASIHTLLSDILNKMYFEKLFE